MITKLCVETTNYRQSNNPDDVAFDEDNSTNIYGDDATIKALVEAYVSALKTRCGKTSIQGRLLNLTDLEDLNVSVDTYNGGDNRAYGVSGLPNFLITSPYYTWTSIPIMTYGTDPDVINMPPHVNSPELSGFGPDADDVSVLRPVIIISKSDL